MILSTSVLPLPSLLWTMTTHKFCNFINLAKLWHFITLFYFYENTGRCLIFLPCVTLTSLWERTEPELERRTERVNHRHSFRSAVVFLNHRLWKKNSKLWLTPTENNSEYIAKPCSECVSAQRSFSLLCGILHFTLFMFMFGFRSRLVPFYNTT